MKISIEHISPDQHLEIKILRFENPDLKNLDQSIFSSAEKESFKNFKSIKRKYEFYFTRFLWQKFDSNQSNQIIQYAPSGKPIINNGHISISHSKNVVAIGYCKNMVIGIDAEHYSNKIFHIIPKFLSKKEQTTFDCNDMTTVTTMWSIKEAVYKLGLEKGMSFRKQIILQSIGEENHTHIITKKFDGILEFHRILYDDFVLTYCKTDKIDS